MILLALTAGAFALLGLHLDPSLVLIALAIGYLADRTSIRRFHFSRPKPAQS